MKYFVFFLTFMSTANIWGSYAEIKLVVPPSEFEKVYKHLDWENQDIETGQIHFIDTCEKNLFKNEFLVRVRSNQKKSDLTLKRRPLKDMDLLSPRWLSKPGFKIEMEQSPFGQSLSVSIKNKLSVNDLDRLLQDPQQLDLLLNKDQRQFKKLFLPQMSPNKRYLVLGRVDFEKVALKLKDFYWPINVEKWKSKSRGEIIEYSSKVDILFADKMLQLLKKILLKNEIKFDPTASGKTKWVYDGFECR